MKIFHFSLFLIAVFTLTSFPVWAKRDHAEIWYQEKWCRENRGEIEYRLPDKTRCDCLTDTHAIEFDFGSKWAEAIGQALYYGLQTGKRPGIVLILEGPKDDKYFIRLNSVIQYYGLPIDTWAAGQGSLK